MEILSNKLSLTYDGWDKNSRQFVTRLLSRQSPLCSFLEKDTLKVLVKIEFIWGTKEKLAHLSRHNGCVHF